MFPKFFSDGQLQYVFGKSLLLDLVVMITHCKLYIYTTLVQFNILMQNKTKYHKKLPQLNFSQANLLVSMDKTRDIVSVVSQNGVLQLTATFAGMDIYYFTYRVT